ncbi:MAG: hypothetical protein WBA68_02220 [Alteraurantiacibacter sp.]
MAGQDKIGDSERTDHGETCSRALRLQHISPTVAAYLGALDLQGMPCDNAAFVTLYFSITLLILTVASSNLGFSKIRSLRSGRLLASIPRFPSG